MVEECLRWWQGVETWEHDARVVVYPLTALASATGIIQRGEELAELAGEVTDAIEEANAYRRESGYSYQAAHRPPVPGRTVNLFLDVRDTA
jgi:hypothetical protein